MNTLYKCIKVLLIPSRGRQGEVNILFACQAFNGMYIYFTFREKEINKTINIR